VRRQYGQRLAKHLRQWRCLGVPSGNDIKGATCLALAKTKTHEPASRGVERVEGGARRVRLSLAKVDHAGDVLAAEDLFGVQLVVAPTEDAKVLRGIRATERSRLDVVQLEEHA
jgi:hypothetical protein